LVFNHPAPAFDHFPVHDGNLAGGPAKTDKPQFGPEFQGGLEGSRFSFRFFGRLSHGIVFRQQVLRRYWPLLTALFDLDIN
jgi:hypothetical protein